jgi:hypothetical protein
MLAPLRGSVMMRDTSCTAFLIAAAGLLAPLTPSPAAQGSKVSSPVELARSADRLGPGQWVWAPSIAPSGPVLVYVDLSRQVATVYRNGVRIGVSTVSTGKPGHETPSGIFTILQKDAHHRSSTYNNAPMPYQERLTWDGVALHAGGLPGYPESHGCIHLPLEFSRLLFAITHLGGTVIVAGRAGAPHLIQAAGLVSPKAQAAGVPLPAKDDYRWTPNRAASGPLSVVISKTDERLLVFRNGVEIGRARVHMPDSDFAPHVLTLASKTAGAEKWVYVGLPGHQGEQGQALDTTALSFVRMPEEFRELLDASLQIGATIYMTPSRVLSSGAVRQVALTDPTDH